MVNLLTALKKNVAVKCLIFFSGSVGTTLTGTYPGAAPFHNPTNSIQPGTVSSRSQAPDVVGSPNKVTSKPPRSTPSRPKSTEGAFKSKRSSGRRSSPPMAVVPFVQMPASLSHSPENYPDFLPRARSPPVATQQKSRTSGRSTPQRSETPDSSTGEPNGVTPTSSDSTGFTRHVYTS